ncbi:hypothetical protein FOA52_010030 [Chlamydomonas sp. UWO 241]|nr:hypothetical protein FOA52_010030 [Chlamydomonas sp. UWO 241]
MVLPLVERRAPSSERDQLAETDDESRLLLLLLLLLHRRVLLQRDYNASSICCMV